MGASNRQVLVVGLLIAVLTVAVYWQVLGFDYVKYDDAVYTGHPLVRAGLTAKGIGWAFTGILSSNWHPVTILSHMLDATLFGHSPMGPHATNLLLHVANALLLLLVLNRMTRTVWPSAFVAALFALHPLHVESVAWIAERKDVLSTFFLMLTVLAYVRYVERPQSARYAWVAFLYALGLMSKPMLVSLPLLLLLLDYWPLHRFHGAKGQSGSAVRGIVIEKTPLFLLAAASCVVTYVVQYKGGAGVSLTQVPLGLRIENAVVSYGAYIWKTVWPAELAIFYPYPKDGPPVWQLLVSALFLVSVSILAFRNASRRPYLAIGWGWYLVTLVPVIGFVQVGQQAMADRYTYVPLIGVFVAVAFGVGRAKSKVESARYISNVLVAISLVVLIALSAVTWRQVGYWQNRYTLFSRALEVTTANFLAHDMVGIELSDRGKHLQAIEQFSKAIAIKPDDDQAYIGLGNAYTRMGRLDEAVQAYENAVRIRPGFPHAHFNLGLVLISQGRLDDCIRHWSEVIEINRGPRGHPEMFATDADESDRRIRQVEAVLRTRPNDPVALCHYAIVLGLRGRLEDAVAELTRVSRMGISPDELRSRIRPAMGGRPGGRDRTYARDASDHLKDPVARFHLANYLQQHGKHDEAIREYRAVLSMKPDLAAVHNNIAVSLYRTGRYAEAWDEVHLAQSKGVQVHPGFLQALRARMPEPPR